MIRPGCTLGILGGGQLGRMIAMAAAQLGLKTHIYAPEENSPAFEVATEVTIAPYEDEANLVRFAKAVPEPFVDGYFARHRVKPGITGWAQINGWRGEIDNEEKIQKRVEFDLYYIENWSVLFDLYILFKTPLALIANNENAY